MSTAEHRVHALPDVPVDTRRTRLYAPSELYDVRPYDASLDARAYAWSQLPPHPARSLAKALHDHYIDEALTTWVRTRRLVGVMGGHDLDRRDEAYREAARLGWALGKGVVVATGGGPGAMEAANLGGLLAGSDERALEEALARLSEVPSYEPSIDAWAGLALDVAAGVAQPHESLGIPTWHYGHEPPNAFATSIAKYFRNATREAILLEVCEEGIVFLPGTGGTVQEVFQDACENYYAVQETVAPMVLVGVGYWTRILPVWPLLQSLAAGRLMEKHIHLVDTVEEAAAVIRSERRA